MHSFCVHFIFIHYLCIHTLSVYTKSIYTPYTNTPYIHTPYIHTPYIHTLPIHTPPIYTPTLTPRYVDSNATWYIYNFDYVKPLQNVYLVYEGNIRGHNGQYYKFPFTVYTLSPANQVVDSKEHPGSASSPVVIQRLVNNFYKLFKWEEERIPIHANRRGKLDFLVTPDVDLEYSPAEDSFFQFFMPNSVVVPDRIYCEMAEIPGGYHVYTNSHNIFDDLDFFPSPDCSFQIFADSVDELNRDSNDSYFDGATEKTKSGTDPDKFYANSGYEFDHNLYSISSDADLNGYTRVRVVPHPDLPLLSGGRRYVVRIDAKFDETDEGLLFTTPGRFMVTSGLYTGGFLAFKTVDFLTVKGPKVPNFHLNSVMHNALTHTMLFLACEFFEKIGFKTSDYLASTHDKIVIHFDTSPDQFLPDLGFKGGFT